MEEIAINLSQNDYITCLSPSPAPPLPTDKADNSWLFGHKEWDVGRTVTLDKMFKSLWSDQF